MPANSRRSVLIVDDEPAIARALKRMLKDCWDVVLCNDAEIALELLRGGTRVSAIVCDMQMPGMSGAEFYQRVRQEFRGLERQIVFMSGGVSTDDATTFLAGIENTCVAKPICREVLEDTLRQLCLPPSNDGSSP